MTTSGISATNVLVALVVLFLVLRRQLTARPLQDKSRLGLILAIVGALETLHFVSNQHLASRDMTLLVISLAIGLGLAALRAYTIRLWRQDGQTYQQGNLLTAALWIISLALHVAIDAMAKPGLGSVSILLYFGIVIVAQQQLLQARARSRAEV